ATQGPRQVARPRNLASTFDGNCLRVGLYADRSATSRLRFSACGNGAAVLIYEVDAGSFEGQAALHVKVKLNRSNFHDGPNGRKRRSARSLNWRGSGRSLM